MAKERNNKEVKTHLDMVKIYDKFAIDWTKKHDGKDITYTDVTRMIAERIMSVGGVKA